MSRRISDPDEQSLQRTQNKTLCIPEEDSKTEYREEEAQYLFVVWL